MKKIMFYRKSSPRIPAVAVGLVYNRWYLPADYLRENSWTGRKFDFRRRKNSWTGRAERAGDSRVLFGDIDPEIIVRERLCSALWGAWSSSSTTLHSRGSRQILYDVKTTLFEKQHSRTSLSETGRPCPSTKQSSKPAQNSPYSPPDRSIPPNSPASKHSPPLLPAPKQPVPTSSPAPKQPVPTSSPAPKHTRKQPVPTCSETARPYLQLRNSLYRN